MLLGHMERWQSLEAAAAAGQKCTSGVRTSSLSLYEHQLPATEDIAAILLAVFCRHRPA